MENNAIKENASNISELENQVNKLKQEIHISQLEKDALEASSALIKKQRVSIFKNLQIAKRQ